MEGKILEELINTNFHYYQKCAADPNLELFYTRSFFKDYRKFI